MGRFDDDVNMIILPEAAEDLRTMRARVEARAYSRWEQEMMRKYRHRLNEPGPPGQPADGMLIEHLCSNEDFDRLDEILKEELAPYGGYPRF